MPARRWRAASMSAIVGAIELEHLLEELPDSAERIELAVLDSGEHALEPGVGGDRLAQVGARTARGDGEHLGREVLAPPRLEPAVARERFTMGIESSATARERSRPRRASVSTISGRRSGSASATIERTSFSIVFAPSRSILLIAITSGISMIPAFSACTESPEPGMRTRSTASAIPVTSTSLWPAPTVSTKTTSFPAASRRSTACKVVSASPPRCPRVPIDRMYTPGSKKWSVRRILSPRSAPREKGLEGSTDTTPTVRPASRR